MNTLPATLAAQDQARTQALTRRQTTLNTGHSMIRVYPAHQTIQVRGRDD